MGPGDAVRPTLHHKGSSILDQLRGALSRRTNRKNPVGIAVNDQRRHVDVGQVFPEVLMPRRYTSQTGGGRRARGDVPVRLNRLFADSLAQQHIQVVEILEEFGEEGVAIRGDSLLNPLEDAAVHTLWIVRGLQ